MPIRKLVLKNFRNVACVYEPDELYNLIIGDNGAGKSNILDAIYMLAYGKSFKPYFINNNINIQKLEGFETFATVGAIYEEEDLKREYRIVFSKDEEETIREKRRFEVNGKPTTKARFAGNINVILFAPHNINLIVGSPETRRNELDDFGSVCDKGFAAKVLEYGLVLRNRNRLLKAINDGKASEAQLKYWDDKLVENGSAIIVQRLKLLEDLKPVMREMAKKYKLPNLEGLNVKYIGKFGEICELEAVKDEFAWKLGENRFKEIAAKQTLYGPQKDDMEFEMREGLDLKVFGSRGQQRIITLLFKLSCWEYLFRLKKVRPIVLLDDVMSELDQHNKEILERVIFDLSAQTFITTTQSSDYAKEINERAKLLKI